MRFKNTFFKWLDKLENVKISPMWGYSFAVCLFLFGAFLIIVQIYAFNVGGKPVLLCIQLGYELFFLAFVLILLTKRSKEYGAKIARFSSMTFWLVVDYLNGFIPSNSQDDYFAPIAPIDYVKGELGIIALFVGYAVGKYIAKKIKDSNMATVKEELSQS